MTSDVTIILCTYNRAPLLPDALASLQHLRTEGRFSYDVLVVDNASTDNTPELVAEVAQRSEVAIRYIRETTPGLSAARNRGIREATSEWLAFFDDDERADSTWLLELWNLAHEKDSRAVGGAVQLVSDASEQVASPAMQQLLAPGGRGTDVRRFTTKDGLNGGNQMLHRTVFEQIGSYDESWRAGGEDTEFFTRLQAAGIAAWYTPRAIVHHLVPDYRLSPEYLTWLSLRQGWSIARKDIESRGLRYALGIAGLRTAKAVTTLCALTAAWLLRDGDRVLLRRCQLCRATGYGRHVLQAVAPAWCRQQRFEQWIEFRGERQQFA